MISVAVAQLLVVRHRSHFMRILQLTIIGVAAFAAMLSSGCSKNTSPIPSVTFQGYAPRNDWDEARYKYRATFDFINPEKLPMVCQVQIQPDISDKLVMTIPPNGKKFEITIPVEQTNAASLSVTVMRLVPAQKISVPIQ